MNLIFAVTEEQLHVYNLLSGAVEGSSYGKRFVPFHFHLHSCHLTYGRNTQHSKSIGSVPILLSWEELVFMDL